MGSRQRWQPEHGKADTFACIGAQHVGWHCFEKELKIVSLIRDESSGRRRARGATGMVGMCWELLEATEPLQSWSFILPGHMKLKFNIEGKKKNFLQWSTRTKTSQ